MAESNEKITIMRVCMPSSGDMELLGQDGGTIDLAAIFYGAESMGPHVHILEGHKVNGKFVTDAVVARYKLRLKIDGKVELKKAHESTS
jgi:hypothetical protein